MTDRYDELSDRARWFLENFDELDIAELCASKEAAIERVRAHRQPFVMWRDIAAALNEPAPATPTATQATETDAELHARRAHPDFEYRTTEGPRKQWDDASTPPADEEGNPDPTWERNIDAGRDGWERFDYTEESYWRRRKAEAARPSATEPAPHDGPSVAECRDADRKWPLEREGQ
jgi:hypothetical protein